MPPLSLPLKVGDVVTVAMPCSLSLEAGARAVVVDIYGVGTGAFTGARSAVLLFRTGKWGGFPREDLAALRVRVVAHIAELASYAFSPDRIDADSRALKGFLGMRWGQWSIEGSIGTNSMTRDSANAITQPLGDFYNLGVKTITEITATLPEHAPTPRPRRISAPQRPPEPLPAPQPVRAPERPSATPAAAVASGIVDRIGIPGDENAVTYDAMLAVSFDVLVKGESEERAPWTSATPVGPAVDRPLTDAQKARIAEARQVYEARIAEREILHRDALRKARSQEEIAKLTEELAVDRDRLARDRDRKIAEIRSTT